MQGVLVVSQSQSLHHWAVAALLPQGRRTVLHENAFGIAVAVVDHRAGLVVLDARMPGLDVTLTCHFLKQWRPRLSVLVLAPLDTPPTMLSEWQAKADLCLVEPVAGAAFADAVERLFPGATLAPLNELRACPNG